MRSFYSGDDILLSNVGRYGANPQAIVRIRVPATSGRKLIELNVENDDYASANRGRRKRVMVLAQSRHYE